MKTDDYVKPEKVEDKEKTQKSDDNLPDENGDATSIEVEFDMRNAGEKYLIKSKASVQNFIIISKARNSNNDPDEIPAVSEAKAETITGSESNDSDENPGVLAGNHNETMTNSETDYSNESPAVYEVQKIITSA